MHSDPLAAEPEDIFMWRRLDGRLTTSGQPKESELHAIAGLGVRHVVNLALHTHEMALANEGASVRALGMAYTHIPVYFEKPTEQDFHRFTAAMKGLAGETVHVHCIANLRVTAFVYRYERERLGVEDQKARLMLESVWRPGGVWAAFIGDEHARALPHRFAGRDY